MGYSRLNVFDCPKMTFLGVNFRYREKGKVKRTQVRQMRWLRRNVNVFTSQKLVWYHAHDPFANSFKNLSVKVFIISIHVIFDLLGEPFHNLAIKFRVVFKHPTLITSNDMFHKTGTIFIRF